jgi:hypothetical protein
MTTDPFLYSRHLAPAVITAPGQYRTRGGEVVTITVACNNYWYNYCTGIYPNGVADSWHRSGRLYSGTLSDNDIVEKLS